MMLLGQLISFAQGILRGAERIIACSMPVIAARFVDEPCGCTGDLSYENEADEDIEAIPGNTPLSPALPQPRAETLDEEADEDERSRHENEQVIGEHGYGVAPERQQRDDLPGEQEKHTTAFRGSAKACPCSPDARP